ncbi:hypothetical protein VSS74_20915 [Conexibacter stalactiti]|uniref:WD40 repeat protein n=1 Tax=Conexibacter stalactiti TaxID=1940611 RepID=A0ABU4HU38_9ACTN|nr:hypothetical protein [Conexibacter stalactiti]MDW5596821.1 hypothetical protein [Conexibacter stalactiti]MEC5037463.1 hypothetical protein [Conexibacter stalactiti]
MRTTTRARRLRASIAAVGAALLLAPAAASADSIAYVKDGNVWLTTPDGARQYQVTFDGGYSTVSQADSGRMVALHGDRIRTFDPRGEIINADGTTRYDIRTPHSYSIPETPFRGPFDPVISPNGMKIAYTWYYTQTGSTPNCNPSTGCQTVYSRQGTGYISPDGRSPFDKPGWSEQTGWVGPSWHADGETLLSDPIQVGNRDAVVHTPGDDSSGLPGGVSPWFFEPAARGGLGDGEMTPDESRMVFVTGEQDEQMFIYRAMGGYPHAPDDCLYLEGDAGDGRYSSPSWSPDGRQLAFADAHGVNVLPLPEIADECPEVREGEYSSRLLIPGATSPDWGPADVPPARPLPPENPGGGGGGGGGGGVVGGGGGPLPGGGSVTPKPDTVKPPRGAAITLPKRVALGVALKRGLPVQLSGLPAGTVKVTASARGTTVASGRAKVGRSGSARVTLRFSAKARKRLQRQRSLTLALKAGKVRASVTLKR